MASTAGNFVIMASSTSQLAPFPCFSNCRQSLSHQKLVQTFHVHFTPSHDKYNRSATVNFAMEVPDYLPIEWNKTRGNKPLGPRFDMTAEDAVSCQLEALRNNDQPQQDSGIEVMYRFAGFDPFQRSRYFGPFFDLGQFERFRRIFHHSTYRVLLGHKETKILSTLYVNEHCFKQRVWVQGARPGEEDIFEFTLVQRIGGCWDGYWLTDSLRHNGDGITGGIAY